MKTIKSIFILVLICITLITSSWKNDEKRTTIIIKALDEIVTPGLLKESADIMSLRLTTYGLDSFHLNINENKGQIAVTVPESCNMGDICRLLTQRGTLALYETYNRDEIKTMPNTEKLLGMFVSSGNQIGWINPSDTLKADNLLKSLKVTENIIFRWGMPDENGKVSLFALKTKGNPLLVKSDIEDVKSSKDGRINVTLRQQSFKKWAEATARNVDRSIAILVDDKVISCPVVRQPMESGKFEISGDFSAGEAGILAALINGDKLPLTFSIVR
jgi:SecD/SecF fusion protein